MDAEIAKTRPCKCEGLCLKNVLPSTIVCTMGEQLDKYKSNLTDHDWLQIDMAARGCVSGNSDEWPSLRLAIEKIRGKPFGMRQSSDWLRGFCEGVWVQSGKERT